MMNLVTSGLVLLSAGSLNAQYSNAVNQVLDDPFNRAVLAASSEATMARNSIQPALNILVNLNAKINLFTTSERETCELQIQSELGYNFNINNFNEAYADMLLFYAFRYYSQNAFTDLHNGVEDCFEATRPQDVATIRSELENSLYSVVRVGPKLDLDWTIATAAANLDPRAVLSIEESSLFCTSTRLNFYEGIMETTITPTRAVVSQPVISDEIQLERINAVLNTNFGTMESYFDHFETEAKKYWLRQSVDPIASFETIYNKRQELYVAEGFTGPDLFRLVEQMDIFKETSDQMIREIPSVYCSSQISGIMAALVMLMAVVV